MEGGGKGELIAEQTLKAKFGYGNGYEYLKRNRLGGNFTLR